jgi:hypothetical protein
MTLSISSPSFGALAADLPHEAYLLEDAHRAGSTQRRAPPAWRRDARQVANDDSAAAVAMPSPQCGSPSQS